MGILSLIGDHGRIEWNDKAFMKSAISDADEIAYKGAQMVASDARSILMSRAKHPTGKLAGEIEIKHSKFEGGGAIVQAQGPGNYDRYYATFVELGTHRSVAVPFLRPALQRNRNRIHKMYQDATK